jgi:signal transduction histidine kinase
MDLPAIEPAKELDAPVDRARVARMRLSPRKRNALVFFSAVLLLLLGGFVTYLTISRLLDAQRWVAHSREVQSALSNVEMVISRAGRTRVQYVQSGDPNYLHEYELSVTETRAAVESIRQMTADNATQQDYCAQLKTLVEQRIGIMNESIAKKTRGEITLEDQAQVTQQIVAVASAMDAITRQMSDLEERLLGERQKKSRELFGQAVALFCVTFVISLALLGLHYSLLTSELNARVRAEASLHRLNARLLEMQDDERRRISRELHDSLGQYLAGAKMGLEVVKGTTPPNPLLEQCVEILDKAIGETRTISHLLHPPLLDEVGFASAAKWYIEGFSERSRIPVKLDLPEKMERLPSPIELVLFRLLQESLTNIHRHSKSANAQISLSLLRGYIQLEVRDWGVGMTLDTLEKFRSNTGYVGIGLSGMRERVLELGGRIRIDSDSSGTRILAVLPVGGSSVGPPGSELNHPVTRRKETTGAA